MTQSVLVADSAAQGVIRCGRPALTRTSSQVLLLAYECVRSDSSDTPHSAATIEVRRSLDHGMTWSDPIVVFGEDPADANQGFRDPSFITDLVTGQVFLMATQYLAADEPRDDAAKGTKTKDSLVRILLALTDDEGATWRHRDISIQVNGANNWLSRKGVSGHGVQLKQGIWTGRMVQGLKVINPEGAECFIAVCSDDHGRTWWSGLPIEASGDGAAVAELSDGRVIMQITECGEGGKVHVKRYYSMDGGRSFGPGLDVPKPKPLGEESDDAPDVSAFTAVLAQAGMVADDDDGSGPQWASAFERCFPCAIPGMEQARTILIPTVCPASGEDCELDELGIAASLNDGQTVYKQIAYVNGEAVEVDLVSLPERRLALTAVQTPSGIEVAHVLLDELGLKDLAYGWNERGETQDQMLKDNGFIK